MSTEMNKRNMVGQTLLDVWDGKPIPRFWKNNNMVKRGETVLATKPRKVARYTKSGYNIDPAHTHDVWTGQYWGYGDNGAGQPCFRTMKNAVAFASAAYRVGYRRKRGH